MKRKVFSLLLAMTLCVGLAISALAEDTISEVKITIPGLDGFSSGGWNPEAGADFETDVSGLTISMKNAPIEYWYHDDSYAETYIFMVQEDFKATTSHLVYLFEGYYDYGVDGIWIPARTLSFEGAYYKGWDEGAGFSLLDYSTVFYKDEKYIIIMFSYISPEGILDLDAPGNEYIKADFEYDGIIDNNDGTGGLPRKLVATRALDKHGFKSHPISELVVGSTPTAGLSTSDTTVTPSSPESPSSWAAESVTAANAAGLVPEALQSKYTTATTRAEFCALAVALYETATGAEITERATFSDTTDINVQKMAGLGVVNGIGDDKFGPENKLTREQAATMLSRLADIIGKPLTAQAPTFNDNDSLSAWAFDAVGQMQATGVMGGVGENTFSPAADYTREQSMITILRLFEIVK